MTDVDEALRDVHHRMNTAGLHLHAAAVAYQVAVMRSEGRTDEQMLAYLRQVDAATAQPATEPVPVPSRRAVRDHIEQALADLLERHHMGRIRDLGDPYQRRVMAGLLRKVFVGQVARLEAELADAQATIARVRAEAARHGGDGAVVPVRLVLDALYGEETR